jgi:hypothetical protein
MINHKAWKYPLDSKTGHSSRLIITQTKPMRIASRSGKVSNINGNKYKTHWGLQPGDHKKNMLKVKPKKEIMEI